VARIIMEMRNDSAAGLDGMSAELREGLIEEAWRIITKVWITNKEPILKVSWPIARTTGDLLM
jgi:hypothetical protein